MENDLNIEINLPITFKLKNKKRENLKGFAGKSMGYSYKAYLVIGTKEQYVGRLKHAEEPIFDGCYMFLYYYDVYGNYEDSFFIESSKLENAGLEILQNMCGMFKPKEE